MWSLWLWRKDLGAAQVIRQRRAQMRVLEGAQVLWLGRVGGAHLARLDGQRRLAQAAPAYQFGIYRRNNHQPRFMPTGGRKVQAKRRKAARKRRAWRSCGASRRARGWVDVRSGVRSACSSGFRFLGRERSEDIVDSPDQIDVQEGRMKQRWTRREDVAKP